MSETQPPLLRDVIYIKESISTSDYVLSLAEATTPEGAKEAVAHYVVTDRLLDNFDDALGLIRSALDSRRSKAAYLHGSFGSGKSHFMAILYALLSGNPAVRGNDAFLRVLAKHSSWLDSDGAVPGQRKRFLLVPYHMLGAKSLEQRVLGGYVKHVRSLHPDAPIPAVYRSDALFDNIRSMRSRLGDEQFFASFVKTDAAASGEPDPWGETFAWTPERLDAAMRAEQQLLEANEQSAPALNLVVPTTPQELRAKLVHDAQEWFPGFFSNAAEDEEGFISLDAGLSVIAAHARSLGYDGLILFLDELILWLANRIHDQKFVSREIDKFTNFVEGADSQRAVPIVSFIARQRDLRELVGQELSGTDQTVVQDALNLASGRFDKITLEDRNLPVIAHERLLKPLSETAAAQISEAFAKAKRKVGPQVWDILLGSDGSTTGADEESFRLTYPFSPVFMDTLVHIASALQRSRTGLKLMGQLLANHRDDARLEQLIPLGDLYAEIADGGDKPFVEQLEVEFNTADKLYRTKLRPHLLGNYSLTEEAVERFRTHPAALTDDERRRCALFAGDNRLICTLLLSALAPSVPALRDLTLRRLYALNHGSITSPIPGNEVSTLRAKVSDWANHFPEIVPGGTDANPTVRLELADVDVDSVLANANVNDSAPNRRSLMRRLLRDELGVTADNRLPYDELKLLWRGTNRQVEVVFGNIADTDDLPDGMLAPFDPSLWRIVVDLPYDEGQFGPREDYLRVDGIASGPADRQPRTLAWIPAHLSARRFQDFRRLVTIHYALEDQQRFETRYASHLNPDNRVRAKTLLESMRGSLTKTVKSALRQAYGLADKKQADIQLGYDDHVKLALQGTEPTLSIGQTLYDGIRHLAGSLLAQQFPAHPDFGDEQRLAVRAADAKLVFEHIRAGAETADGRIEIPAKDRDTMRRIAQRLDLGVQKEAYFELSRRWADHFSLKARSEGITGDLPHAALARWIDEPLPFGLEPFLVNLVLASFAEMSDRIWVRGGVPLDPAPDILSIKEMDALRSQPLPSEHEWQEAGERFREIFGKPAPALRRSRVVANFARGLAHEVRAEREHARDLVTHLERHAALLTLDSAEGAGPAGRLGLARRCIDLFDAVLAEAEQPGGSGSHAKAVISAFAGFDLEGTSASRYGASVKQAAKVVDALVKTNWDILKLAAGLGVEGKDILDRLRGVARVDQLTSDLVEALQLAQREVLRLVERRNRATPTPTPTPAPTWPSSPTDAGSTSATRPGAVDLTTATSQPPVPADAEPGEEAGSAAPETTNGRTSGPARRSGGGRTTASRAVAELTAELAGSGLPPDAVIEVSWRVVE